MNMKQRANKFLMAAAGIGVILMVSANPAMADNGRHHGYGHAKGHHAYGHHKHHRHHRHHRRHYVVADHHLRYAYPVTDRPYVAYQQPHYATGGASGAAYHGSSPNFGNAVGGALGGYLGSKIGKGSGQLAATAAGAVIGYSIGGRVGAQY